MIVVCILFNLCQGFTGTVGAVKAQSSVDVYENRSSKSMDDNYNKLLFSFFIENKFDQEGRRAIKRRQMDIFRFIFVLC